MKGSAEKWPSYLFLIGVKPKRHVKELLKRQFALEFVLDWYKTKKLSERAAGREPYALDDGCDEYKIREVCK